MRACCLTCLPISQSLHDEMGEGCPPGKEPRGREGANAGAGPSTGPHPRDRPGQAASGQGMEQVRLGRNRTPRTRRQPPWRPRPDPHARGQKYRPAGPRAARRVNEPMSGGMNGSGEPRRLQRAACRLQLRRARRQGQRRGTPAVVTGRPPPSEGRLVTQSCSPQTPRGDPSSHGPEGALCSREPTPVQRGRPSQRKGRGGQTHSPHHN